jgi:hypothetical protein
LPATNANRFDPPLQPVTSGLLLQALLQIPGPDSVVPTPAAHYFCSLFKGILPEILCSDAAY